MLKINSSLDNCQTRFDIIIVRRVVKLFGCALDVLDVPERVAIKRAWVNALSGGIAKLNDPRDPYDVLASRLVEEAPSFFEKVGKIELPTWMTPRPDPVDMPYLNGENFRMVMEEEIELSVMNDCIDFCLSNILPSICGLLATDHSTSAGSYLACADYYGMENISLLVIDSHFDAVPLPLRIPIEKKNPHFALLRDTFNCGNFIGWLIDEFETPPANILVVGPSDYPPPPALEEREDVHNYRQAYFSFLERGVKVFPKNEVRDASFWQEFDIVLDSIKTPYVYVSLDADAGSANCTNAVRFMDTVGLDEMSLMKIAWAVSKRVEEGKFELAGFDVCEVDVHLLGLEGPDGEKDRTEEVCNMFIKILTGCET